MLIQQNGRGQVCGYSLDSVRIAEAAGVAEMDDHKKYAPVAPHPIIGGYYSKQSERLPFVRTLFNETARDYDVINWLFSLGSGARYRRRCLTEAGLRPGDQVVDVAVGTGLLAREAVAIVGDRRHVIGLDLSEGMIAVAREKLRIPLVQGAAEQLPLANEIADFVTMGYAIRHVSDLITVFREFHRILRKEGTALLLEISKPEKRLNRMLASAYLGRVVPFLARWSTGQAHTQTLMQYYWETIENCVPADVILTAMRESGFQEVHCKVELGLFRSYVGRKH
jgi:demethylmenaquinone methyltransferase/2-methoxy-6-polyprenyl-1,4-benzoquinol methylase